MSAAGNGPVTAAYENLVREGALAGDANQRGACRVLDAIAQALTGERSGGGFLRPLFKSRPSPVKGAYLVGEVGRGKSMLMDLFFAQVPIKAKRRVHFHQFMTEIHAAVTAFRRTRKGQGDNADPIAAVVKPIIGSVKLLCLDEFHVQDITNAMILQRLFERLYAGGVVVVATSNVEPERLYENGLNRQLFLPFIALLQAHSHLVRLDGPTDYRRTKLGGQAVFFFGAPAQTRARLDALWARLTQGEETGPQTLHNLGRAIPVPVAGREAARFGFADLCEAPLGASDYLKLADAYETVVIDDVPRFDRTRSNAAKRFILLVDTLYDRGIKLAAGFAAPLEELGEDERTRFEFARCVSRLVEMQSEGYLGAPRRLVSPALHAQG